VPYLLFSAEVLKNMQPIFHLIGSSSQAKVLFNGSDTPHVVPDVTPKVSLLAPCEYSSFHPGAIQLFVRERLGLFSDRQLEPLILEGL
jgi:hypothetical protein